MLELDTFLTALYVMADDYCKAVRGQPKPGPKAGLAPAEVLTLSILGQFSRLASEQEFYRFASNHLRGAFPGLPERSRFNRLERRLHRLAARFAIHLCDALHAKRCPYEALDATAVPVRNVKRRGRGHLAGVAALGHSGRLGWYEGFHLILACSPEGVVTGFAFGAANVNERRLADDFFAARQYPQRELPSVGTPARGCYVADKGFSGERPRAAWLGQSSADVISAPERCSHACWPEALEQWISRLRQVVESVFEHLHNRFGLDRERPHTLEGFWARLSAKVALHNFCIWINRLLGQPPLTIAGLINW